MKLVRPERPWTGCVVARRRYLHIKVKDAAGKWRFRSTGLVAVQENWDKAEALLSEVRAGLLANQPERETMAQLRRRVLPSFRGSPAIRLTLKRRLARSGHVRCESCGWAPPPPATWRCLNVHHVVARSKGGTDDPANLVVLCPNCHAVAHALQKGGLLPLKAELLAALAMVPEVPDSTTGRASTDVASG